MLTVEPLTVQTLTVQALMVQTLTVQTLTVQALTVQTLTVLPLTAKRVTEMACHVRVILGVPWCYHEHLSTTVVPFVFQLPDQAHKLQSHRKTENIKTTKQITILHNTPYQPMSAVLDNHVVMARRRSSPVMANNGTQLASHNTSLLHM